MILSKELRYAAVLYALLACFLINSPSAFCQDYFSCFKPCKLIKTDSLIEKKIMGFRDNNIAAIQVNDKDIKKAIREEYNERYNWILDMVKEGDLLIDSEIEKYISRIVDNIKKANPEIKQDALVLPVRYAVPNAVSLGDGTIIVTLGFIHYVRNEAELAFVLCHEMAHLQLDHSNKKIASEMERLNSKSFQKDLKKILSETYNVRQKLVNYSVNHLLISRRMSRQEELEADSVGLKFFLKTNYDPLQAPLCMDMLESIDDHPLFDSLDIKRFFTMEQVPSRQAWYYYEGASSLGEFEEEKKDSLADSLSTHPDCPLRKAALDRQLKADKATAKQLYIQPEVEFKKFKFNGEGEFIQTCFNNGRLDCSIFLSLKMLEKYPANIYPRSIAALSMGIYSMRQEKRNVGFSIGLPSIDNTDDYNRFLSFLRQLKINESGGFSYWMLRPEKKEFEECEEYLVAMTVSAFSLKKKEECLNYKSAYLKKFEKGNYIDEIKDLYSEK